MIMSGASNDQDEVEKNARKIWEYCRDLKNFNPCVVELSDNKGYRALFGLKEKSKNIKFNEGDNWKGEIYYDLRDLNDLNKIGTGFKSSNKMRGKNEQKLVFKLISVDNMIEEFKKDEITYLQKKIDDFIRNIHLKEGAIRIMQWNQKFLRLPKTDIKKSRIINNK